MQTTDFFTPIVDDPYKYGQIAAANALSDVYAMGGRPITAMNIVGMPTDKTPSNVINRILKGGAEKVKEAGCCLVGGHSIKNPEPIYGLSVTGIVHPRRMLTNADARPGDLLVLTKPLGTGIATTGIKRGLVSDSLTNQVTELMQTLNTVGSELAEQALLRAATDVTGFGLLGHLASLCRASGVGAEVAAADVPALDEEILRLIARDCIPGGTRTNLETVGDIVEWNAIDTTHRFLLADAQTSGGLLLCVPPKNIKAVRNLLQHHGTPCHATIGRITESPNPHIVVI